MTEKKTEAEHNEIIQRLEEEINVLHKTCSQTRTVLHRAKKDCEKSVLDYMSQWPRLTPLQNLRHVIESGQQTRRDRIARGESPDGPAYRVKTGNSLLDIQLAAQRGYRKRTGADARRGAYPHEFQNRQAKLPSEK